MKISWTALWSTIVDSSIWDLSDMVCKVWVTMLALKDEDHVVRRTAYQIGRAARKTEKEVMEALEILQAPDATRIEPQEFDGRRVQKVPEGWLILNGAKYQQMIQEIINQRNKAKWQADQRMIEKAVSTGQQLDPATLPPKLRKRYEKALEKGKRAMLKLVAHQGEVDGRTHQIAVNLQQSNGQCIE